MNNLNEVDLLASREKRSLIPIIGKVLSFLFGTVSKDDVGTIKQNVEQLVSNQRRITHVVEQSISILNVSRIENRQSNHEVMVSLLTIDKKLRNISVALEKEIAELEHFVE